MERRCPSCGGELVQRLGDVECAGCGMRVLRHESVASKVQRDPSAAPWDPPSSFASAVAPPQRETAEATPEAAQQVQQLGLHSGGMYRPRMREVASPRLQTEKWIFLAAFFLGNVFVTYAYLNSDGPQGAQGISPLSILCYVALSTGLAAFVVYSHSASIKNGCMFLVVGSVLLGAFSIYKQVSSGTAHAALLSGLIVQTLVYGWLGAILLRENELE